MRSEIQSNVILKIPIYHSLYVDMLSIQTMVSNSFIVYNGFIKSLFSYRRIVKALSFLNPLNAFLTTRSDF